MKKFILIIPILIFCSCVDNQHLKEDIKQELVNEIDTVQHPQKGDGSYFYNEPIKVGSEDMFIHHSTLSCPKIQKGVLRNCYKLDYYFNIFCPVCMDDKLIDDWTKLNFPKKL